jgi:hypothetical protein
MTLDFILLKDSNRAFVVGFGPEINFRTCLFIHSFISVRVPRKEISQEMGGKHAVSFHGDPSGRKGYIHWSAVWFLKAGVCNKGETCVVPHAEGVATHILQKAGHVRLVPELWPR